jgi:hypothetical protein
MAKLISFDIDGTLEVGNPPGWVTMQMVRRAKEFGYIIGSASDKPIPLQKMIWEQHGIEVAFTIHKQNLDQVRAQFEAELYQHIGDTNMDEHYAVMHGFEYLDVAMDLNEPWMLLEEMVEEVMDAMEAAVERLERKLDQALPSVD